jgi:hypothetical protein
MCDAQRNSYEIGYTDDETEHTEEESEISDDEW